MTELTERNTRTIDELSAEELNSATAGNALDKALEAAAAYYRGLDILFGAVAGGVKPR